MFYLKKIGVFIFFVAHVGHLSLLGAFSEKINFWNVQQKGANVFSAKVTLSDIQAAKAYGIAFIRLSPDKFSTAQRDFLIGNADEYRGLIKEDLEYLKKILDMCYREKLFVVITMLSLPGSRWKQNNKNNDDLRIWKDEKFENQAALFWKDLAAALKDHPAIVGYNILNEPHPERIFVSQESPIESSHQKKAQKMLYSLYECVIKQIRVVDVNTPIILDSSAYADPKAFEWLSPHKDQNILYSFHMYEPYEYTNRKINNGRFKYPGEVNGKVWDKKTLYEYMNRVSEFQKKHKMQSNKIIVGEFGGHRTSIGLENYFEDLIEIFNKEGWHFAFYAFREDTWDGMDYELGNKKLPWSYWQAIERGETPALKRESTFPAFTVLKESLRN